MKAEPYLRIFPCPENSGSCISSTSRAMDWDSWVLISVTQFCLFRSVHASLDTRSPRRLAVVLYVESVLKVLLIRSITPDAWGVLDSAIALVSNRVPQYSPVETTGWIPSPSQTPRCTPV
eukprot:Rmarinus@m.17999